MQIKFNTNALHFFSRRFLVFFSRDENLLSSTFPVMFFLKFYLYSTFKPLDITAFFFKYIHHELKIQKASQVKTTCTKKTWSRQRTIVTVRQLLFLSESCSLHFLLLLQPLKACISFFDTLLKLCTLDSSYYLVEIKKHADIFFSIQVFF